MRCQRTNLCRRTRSQSANLPRACVRLEANYALVADKLQLKKTKISHNLMAGLLTDEQLVRELRVLYANKPMQFNKLITKYYQGRTREADHRHSQDVAGLAEHLVLCSSAEAHNLRHRDCQRIFISNIHAPTVL